MALIRRLPWPSSLAGRTTLLLLAALGAFHALSVGLHQRVLDTAVVRTRDAALAERIVAIRQALAAQPPERREAEAHALSATTIEVHWDTAPVVRPASPAAAGEGSAAHPEGLEAELRRALALADPAALRLAFEGLPPGQGGQGGHVALVSVALPDGTWLNLRAVRFPVPGGHEGMRFWPSLSIMALGIVVVSVFVVRGLTAPLRSLAAAADAMDPNGGGAEVPEDGPDEVRHTAAAFNRMRARIRRMFEEQRRALAAMSHDLMSPIARLRYRVDALEDAELRRRFGRDLDEMEAMARGVLDLLRGETEAEAPRRFDLAATLRTICDDLADRGADVAYDGPDRLAIEGRHLALKRAFANLVENAVRHGGGSAVRVALRPAGVDRRLAVEIADEGPGIPAAELDRVCEPFYRVDKARGRETGGSGLGLAVAKAAVERHGGRLALRNRPGGGLAVLVTLPTDA
ncbi:MULTISPECIES: cell wall metabolism sensor histidine kinase WalK [Acetobacterales]|uniref:histidine kinase n=1 Tax=Caldovatus aquaticus TaxID=2865671 RepID=A0ABS7F5A4_9PROT|nr:HAMP domain-containing sensor histidine kinase [Caldovatus aquaticus]MBW8270811.1 HAMP domain-containing histidine kinase [Caldovatus aquaticus]